jgi:hypothetical protein
MSPNVCLPGVCSRFYSDPLHVRNIVKHITDYKLNLKQMYKSNISSHTTFTRVRFHELQVQNCKHVQHIVLRPVGALNSEKCEEILFLVVRFYQDCFSSLQCRYRRESIREIIKINILKKIFQNLLEKAE